MENFQQDFGYILYRTELPEPVNGGLVIKDLHDFATVYVDGVLVDTMDRRNAAPDGSLPPVQIKTSGPAQLDILVANDGRVNVDHTMRTETKGITGMVVVDGRPLSNWQVYTLPMTAPMHTAAQGTKPHPSAAIAPHAATKPQPAFFQATFTLNAVGDTFLDTRGLGKGAVWINGHNLGRFWSVGPQQTLYVPAPWLHKGANEIVVFDLLPQAHESVTGLDHPILDGPVSDKTTSNQE